MVNLVRIAGSWSKSRAGDKLHLFSESALRLRFYALTLFFFWAAQANADPVDWVNLYIGTGSGPIGMEGLCPSSLRPSA
jgi:hypothetical protein